ncbi:MAG TPA: glycosyltransferase family 4 protein [Nitrospiraceae bacterium]|nr:glycosyltransferase family 4 protein [Nitrospiraceae bacterium]
MGSLAGQRARLLVVVPFLPSCHGTVTSISALVGMGLAECFDVTYFDPGITSADGTAVPSVGSFVPRLARFVWLLLRKRPHLIYLVLSNRTRELFREGLLILTARLFGAQVVTHLRGAQLVEWYQARFYPVRILVRSIFRMIHLGLLPGDSLKGLYSELIPESKLAVVPNGVDDIQRRERLGETSQPRAWRILHLNFLDRAKGSLVLLAAIPTVLRHRTDVEFVFAGPWLHSDQEREAHRYVEQHGLGSYVQFTGEVMGTEKERLFQSADLFVFPGIGQEGQPLVVLEAMASGLPVVYTDRGCLRETVIDGEAGVEAYTNDPYDLAVKICDLLDRPEEMARLGLNARLRYRSYFTQTRYTDQMIRVLVEAVGYPSSASPPSLIGPLRLESQDK